MKNEKKERQKFLELTRNLIDNALSKNKELTTLDLYEILDNEFQLLKKNHNNSISKYKGKERIKEIQFRLNQEYRDIVSETMRWIKKQILLQKIPIDTVLSEEKIGRR